MLRQSEAALVSFNDEVVIIGGNNFGATATVQSFAVKDNMWKYFAPLPVPRLGHTAITVYDKIYVFGMYALGSLLSLQISQRLLGKTVT